MSTYGRQSLDTGGRGLRVSADGQPRWKAGGVTVDWSTVAANAGGATLTYDGTVVPAGVKYLEGGTVLNKITATGKYGPFTSGAANGLELATSAVRGDSFILDQTVLESDPHSDHVPVFDGGLIYKSRVVGKAGNPTEAQIEAMFPDITFVND
jgi:hypothetical protein